MGESVSSSDSRETIEYRDCYGFLRNRLWVLSEQNYLSSRSKVSQAHDLEWLAFLSELGAKRGPSFGVARLLRDACGDVRFVEDPMITLNAVSPFHGRIRNQGIGGNSSSMSPKIVSSKNSAPRNENRFATKSEQSVNASIISEISGRAPESPCYPTASKSDESDRPSAPTGSSHRRKLTSEEELELESMRAAVVVSIYKRCWSDASIGYAVPPGLGISLPGTVPKEKLRTKYLENLHRLILNGGISPAFRGSVWWELSGAHAKASMHAPDYYIQLTQLKPTSDSEYAILKDLDRTFPAHPYFESSSGRDALFRVLSAFSLHNSEIGYCQSLNFVAGFLLLILPEFQAFWVLDVIVNEILPPDYYTHSLTGSYADQRVLAHLVDEMLPSIGRVLSETGILMPVVSLEWFMCLFTTALPVHTSLRMWDLLFLYGSEVLFKVIISIFHLNEDKILSVSRSSTSSSIQVQVTQTSSGVGSNASSNSEGGGVVELLTAPRPSLSSFFRSSSQSSSGPLKDSPLLFSPDQSSGAYPAAPAVTVTVTSTLQTSPRFGFMRGKFLRSLDSASAAGGASVNQKDSAAATNALSAIFSSQLSEQSPAGTGSASSRASSDPASPPAMVTPTLHPLDASTDDPPCTTDIIGAADSSTGDDLRYFLAHGGTARSAGAVFPAMFALLKQMLGNAHDPDIIISKAYPAPGSKEAKKGLPWHCMNPQRLSMLRQLARAQIESEMGEVQELRQQRSPK